MGNCLSCRRTSQKANQDPERSYLLPADDPYNAYRDGYGSTNQGLASRNILNPEEAKREQEALEGITRWTTDAVIDVFPHAVLSHGGSHTSLVWGQLPGDKSSNVRIYPTSSPVSQTSADSSLRSKSSAKKPTQPRVFKTLVMSP